MAGCILYLRQRRKPQCEAGGQTQAFRKKLYRNLEELQADLDESLEYFNSQRTHQGRWCHGKTPMQTFLDSVALVREKALASAS